MLQPPRSESHLFRLQVPVCFWPEQSCLNRNFMIFTFCLSFTCTAFTSFTWLTRLPRGFVRRGVMEYSGRPLTGRFGLHAVPAKNDRTSSGVGPQRQAVQTCVAATVSFGGGRIQRFTTCLETGICTSHLHMGGLRASTSRGKPRSL